jgi:beta-glucanase (GH16 family)
MTVTDDSRTVDGTDYPYRSGTVHSAPGMVIRSGDYVEARIEVPTCDGCWPAFWAVPQGGKWPPEIDVMENFDTATQVLPTFNYIDEKGGKTGPTPYGQPEVDYRSGYHVYGLLWKGTTLTPYVDGVAYPSVTAKDLPKSGLGLILNLSVARGGSAPQGTRMSVDWLRVWTAST